ncbi:SMC family ATPase [SAR202 cluster bacterium AC-409-J13_OGT_754m]|nr:SMC family ATPase [SAR202 cluster bacterium AC-409-J13_OGT_754m]
MIPTKLSLENFLSYGSNVSSIDLSDIHIACLCGPNGHGKSAFLDAITWALWGNARGKSQDQLVHFGEKHMWVDLEFSVRDTIYRVIRRHTISGIRNRVGKSDLQLQQKLGDEFITITGDTIRKTQSQIQDLIGMDYDTFINSAFLIQGRADEFTNKSPGERKEVLSKILRLSFYDLLQERSRQKANDNQREAEHIQANLDILKQQIENRSYYQTEREQYLDAISNLKAKIVAKKQEFDSLQRQKQSLDHFFQEIQSIKLRIPSLTNETHIFAKDIETRKLRISEFQKLIQNQVTIEQTMRNYDATRQKFESLNKTRLQYDELKSISTKINQSIVQEKALLEQQAENLETRIVNDLSPFSSKALYFQSELDRINTTLHSLSEKLENINEQRESIRQLDLKIGNLTANQDSIKNDGEDLKRKLDMVSEHPDSAECPLCNNPLSTNECEQLAQLYKNQMAEKRKEYKKNDTNLAQIQSQKNQMIGEMQKSENLTRGMHNNALREEASMAQNLQRSQEANSESERLNISLTLIKSELAKSSYAYDEQKKLQEIDNQIRILSYKPNELQTTYDELMRLSKSEQQSQQLKVALVELPKEQASLAQLEELNTNKLKDIEQATQRLSELLTIISEKESVEQNFTETRSDLITMENSQNDLIKRSGDIEASLKRFAELEIEIENKTSQILKLRSTQNIYQELAYAFGRQGIQALIIETILPNIEVEANRLLSRMSEGQMSLSLETQREMKTRKGEYAETLDIRISDELGPRPYEMFSGGEAFRINLALRIALSKVLANRSGAPLPTLFIDEGFGTQDGAGRERILDVIQAIQPDFERIIVITHLEELKESFPTRIEVLKTNGSSNLWIT